VSWINLSRNNFSCYLQKIGIEENKIKMVHVFDEIKSFVNSIPLNGFSCLPRGGTGYIEVLSKYNF